MLEKFMYADYLLMSGRNVLTPRMTPKTLISTIFLYVSIETHSTSP